MRWEIKTGDCLEELRSLPDSSVHAIITDPPYCSGGFTEMQKQQAPAQGVPEGTKWFAGDNMGTGALVWLLRSIAFEAVRLLVPGGSLCFFCDWRQWSNVVPVVESGGLRLQSMLVWDKGSTRMGTGFKPTHELIAHLCNGPGRFHSLTGSNVLRGDRISGQSKLHPTQKPVEVMAAIVRVVTPRDGLVVDPFMGSGSTGVAACNEGRRFLGIERDAGYVQVAKRRLSQSQASFFEPGPMTLIPEMETG